MSWHFLFHPDLAEEAVQHTGRGFNVCLYGLGWYSVRPGRFPFISVMMAFLISAFVGFSQLVGNSVPAGGMSGNNSGAGRFSSSLKCSTHRFSCSPTVVSGLSSFSFTGLSVYWNLPASFLVVRCRSLKLP